MYHLMNTVFFWSCLHIFILIFKYFTNICCVLKLNVCVIVLKLHNLDLGPCLFSGIESIFECWLISWMFFKLVFFFFNIALWKFHLHPVGSLDCNYTGVCLWRNFRTAKALSVILVCNVSEYHYCHGSAYCLWHGCTNSTVNKVM
jgi:hypothetical protein